MAEGVTRFPAGCRSFLDAPESGPEYLLPNLLHRTSTLVSGNPNVGKTSLMLHLAKAVAMGGEILGRPLAEDAQPRPVLYVGSDPDWHNNLRDYWREHFGRNDLITKDRLPPYEDLDAWASMAEDFCACGIGLVVFDHLRGLTGEINLDRDEELQPVWNCYRQLIDRGIPVLLGAHSNRSGGKAGHSAQIQAWARVRIEINGEARDGTRTLQLVPNTGPRETLKVTLRGTDLSLSPGSPRNDRHAPRQEQRARRVQLSDYARWISDLPEVNRSTAAECGRALADSAVWPSVRTADYGRKLATKCLSAGYLQRDDISGSITSGPNLRE